MKHPWSGLKNIPRNIWLLSVSSLINRTGMMVLPFIALYSTKELGVSTGTAGLVLAFYGIGAFISAPFSGKLSDKLGSLNVMKISLFASGFFLILFSFITNFIAFLILTLIWAVINEAFRPASMSFISKEITSKRRKTAFALYRLAINLGMSIGPVIGGFLSTINFSLLFYVDGLTSIAAGIFMIYSPWQKIHEPEESHDKDKLLTSERGSVFKNSKFIFFLLATIPVQIVFFQHIGAMPLFIVNELGFSTSTFGLLIAVNTILIILIEVPLNDAMSNWSNLKALSLGALLYGIGFGMMAIMADLTPLIISIVVWTFGEMIFLPSAGVYVAEISPEKQRGEYMGYYQMTFSFAFMIGPWLGAEVLEHIGSFSLWTGCFALGAISALMMLKLGKGFITDDV
ncbi:MAG: MFS transporter [Bacteroidetes bacterium]|nr:MFS transporter [Bacteroidota bacterium]